MALIGPRPALPREVAAYQRYMLNRLDVKPGITGLWQVSGRADISFNEQIKLDVQYVQERSFFMDLKILFATVPAVLTGKGAY
jgi:lipopolysaccharide/colanic/teichoic acid biosynthesis glycosyltransferase